MTDMQIRKANEEQALIEAVQLSFVYENEEGESYPALDRVDLSIPRGSFVAIAGRNGSGKSTLAKHMNALLLPTGGAIYIEGTDTAKEQEVWKLRRIVGMVFQNPDNQLVSSIVEDDVAFGPENIGVEPAEIRRRVDEALKSVGMYEHRKKGPHLLSGGQKQRVAIAGVLAMDPDCIVFDEPTAMLDPSGRAEILAIIERLHAEGRTVILITHFMEEAVRADRVVIMDGGRIALDGTPQEVFRDPGALKRFHLNAPFAARLAQKLREGGLPLPEGILTEEELAEKLCALKQNI